MAQRSAELYSISVCPNRRRPRRLCGARLCEPQHVDSDRCAGLVKTLGGRQSSCGSQTRAPLVAASPRWAVSPTCSRRIGWRLLFVLTATLFCLSIPVWSAEVKSDDNHSKPIPIAKVKHPKPV